MRNSPCTDEKEIENVYKILLDGICDTVNLLVEADSFGAESKIDIVSFVEYKYIHIV